MKYEPGIAKVIENDIAPNAVMQHTPTETIRSILGRVGVESESGYPKDVYVAVLLDAIMEEEKYILTILTEDTIDFLIRIWECKGYYAMEDYEWNYLEYLKIFGILAYRKGNPLTKEPHEIHIITSMKDQFYFRVKSKKTEKLIRKYSEWERVAAGMLYYYGIMTVEAFYDTFARVMGDVDYEEFYRFIKCRSSLWSIGSFLKAQGQEVEYFCENSVKNPDLLLLYLGEHPKLSYKNVSRDDFIYISEAGGIDNRWPGVSELGIILVDEYEMNYYRATAVVKNLIQYVQNGASIEKLYDQVDALAFAGEEQRYALMEAADLLYESVPVFEYKGYNRKEFEKLLEEIQLQKRKETFTIINGCLVNRQPIDRNLTGIHLLIQDRKDY